MFDNPTHIFLNPVRAERAADFESFLADVVEPALRAHRPHLVGRWHVLRADGAQTDTPQVVTYALIFDGGDLEEDWDLDKLLSQHRGDGEAARLLATFASTFASYGDWVHAIRPPLEEVGQVGWTFTPVGMAGDTAEGPRPPT